MSSVLTGITTNGSPHLGNYVGAMRPAIELSKKSKSFIFLADYHSLIKQQDPKLTHQSTLSIAAAWIACDLDLKNTIFYRQSSIPQIMELNWILTSITPKGLMNRAHAYKALQDSTSGKDKDRNVQMGLFNYPILMSSDILIFNADLIPVGSDQKQHIEMTRDIAQRFNHNYGDILVVPEAVISEETATLSGLDGRKMSKSYDNVIPLFVDEKKLKKLIMKVKTNSLEPGEKKDKNDSILFDIFQAFSSKEETRNIEKLYEQGIAWGEMKKILFECINDQLKPAREKYQILINDPKKIENELISGAKRAREISIPYMHQIRSAVGIRKLF